MNHPLSLEKIIDACDDGIKMAVDLMFLSGLLIARFSFISIVGDGRPVPALAAGGFVMMFAYYSWKLRALRALRKLSREVSRDITVQAMVHAIDMIEQAVAEQLTTNPEFIARAIKKAREQDKSEKKE